MSAEEGDASATLIIAPGQPTSEDNDGDAPTTRKSGITASDFLSEHNEEEFQHVFDKQSGGLALSQSELMEIMRAFDANKNGSLSKQELLEAARLMELHRSQDQDINIEAFPTSLHPILESFDHNGDGSICVAELSIAARLFDESKKENKRMRWAIAIMAGLFVLAMFSIGVLVYSLLEATKETSVSSDGAIRAKGSDVMAVTATPLAYALLSNIPEMELKQLDALKSVHFIAGEQQHKYTVVGATKANAKSKVTTLFFSVMGRRLVIDPTVSPTRLTLEIDNGNTVERLAVTEPAANSGRRLLSQARNEEGLMGKCDARGVCLHSFEGMMKLHGHDATENGSSRRLLQVDNDLNDQGMSYVKLDGDPSDLVRGSAAFSAAEDAFNKMFDPKDLFGQVVTLKMNFFDKCSNYPLERCWMPISASEGLNLNNASTPYPGLKKVDSEWYFGDEIEYAKDSKSTKVTMKFAHDPEKSRRRHVVLMSADNSKGLEYEELTEYKCGKPVTKIVNCKDISVANGRRLLEIENDNGEGLSDHERLVHHHVRRKLRGFGHIKLNIDSVLSRKNGQKNEGSQRRLLNHKAKTGKSMGIDFDMMFGYGQQPTISPPSKSPQYVPTVAPQSKAQSMAPGMAPTPKWRSKAPTIAPTWSTLYTPDTNSFVTGSYELKPLQDDQYMYPMFDLESFFAPTAPFLNTKAKAAFTPTAKPSSSPSSPPTVWNSESPTYTPTDWNPWDSYSPTNRPTVLPAGTTEHPTMTPTFKPTVAPTSYKVAVRLGAEGLSCTEVCGLEMKACHNDDRKLTDADIIEGFYDAGVKCKDSKMDIENVFGCSESLCEKYGAPYISKYEPNLCFGGEKMPAASCSVIPSTKHHQRLCLCSPPKPSEDEFEYEWGYGWQPKENEYSPTFNSDAMYYTDSYSVSPSFDNSDSMYYSDSMYGTDSMYGPESMMSPEEWPAEPEMVSFEPAPSDTKIRPRLTLNSVNVSTLKCSSDTFDFYDMIGPFGSIDMNPTEDVKGFAPSSLYDDPVIETKDGEIEWPSLDACISKPELMTLEGRENLDFMYVEGKKAFTGRRLLNTEDGLHRTERGRAIAKHALDSHSRLTEHFKQSSLRLSDLKTRNEKKRSLLSTGRRLLSNDDKNFTIFGSSIREPLDKMLGFESKPDAFKMDFSNPADMSPIDIPNPVKKDPSKACAAFYEAGQTAAAEIDSFLMTSMNDYYNALNSIRDTKMEVEYMQYTYADLLKSFDIIQESVLYYKTIPVVGHLFDAFSEQVAMHQERSSEGIRKLDDFMALLNRAEESERMTSLQNTLDMVSIELYMTRNFLFDDMPLQMSLDTYCPSEYHHKVCKRSTRKLTKMTARLRRQLKRGLKVATSIVKPVNLLLDDLKEISWSYEFQDLSYFFWYQLPMITEKMSAVWQKPVTITVPEVESETFNECRVVDVPCGAKMCDGKKKINICECDGPQCCFKKEFHYEYVCGTKYCKEKVCGDVSCPVVKENSYSYTLADISGGIPLPENSEKKLIEQVKKILPTTEQLMLDFTIPDLPNISNSFLRKVKKLSKQFPTPAFPKFGTNFDAFPKKCTASAAGDLEYADSFMGFIA